MVRQSYAWCLRQSRYNSSNKFCFVLFKQVGFLLETTEILHNFLLLFFLYFSVLQMQCSKYHVEIYTAILKAFSVQLFSYSKYCAKHCTGFQSNKHHLFTEGCKLILICLTLKYSITRKAATPHPWLHPRGQVCITGSLLLCRDCTL